MIDYDSYGPTFGSEFHIQSFGYGPHQLGLPARTTYSSVNCRDNNGYEHCAEGPYALAGSQQDWTIVGLEVLAVELVPAYTGMCGVLLMVVYIFMCKWLCICL